MTFALPRARLLHVMTVPESLGFLRGQIGYVQGQGFTVAALASPDGALAAFGREEGVAVFGVEMPRQITPVRDLAALWRVWRRIRAWQPDVVHAHTPKGGLLGTAGAWLARVPVRIYHIHGLPFVTATGLRLRLLRLSERVSCRLATHVLCVSESVAAVAVAEGLCPPGKVAVLGAGSINGIDAGTRFSPDRVAGERRRIRERYGIGDDAVVIGFVGRIVADKGVAELALAWSRLRARHGDLHLLLVGAREDRSPALDAALAPLADDPRVHWHGLDWETPPLYAAMDIVALPSYREGFGLVSIEAAAMRLPMVTTRVPGCVDAVEDGHTGTLVPARDAAALAEALDLYIRDSGLRRRHGEAGRQRVLRDFRQEVLWEATASLYARLLARAGTFPAAPSVPAESADPTRPR